MTKNRQNSRNISRNFSRFINSSKVAANLLREDSMRSNTNLACWSKNIKTLGWTSRVCLRTRYNTCSTYFWTWWPKQFKNIARLSSRLKTRSNKWWKDTIILKRKYTKWIWSNIWGRRIKFKIIDWFRKFKISRNSSS